MPTVTALFSVVLGSLAKVVRQERKLSCIRNIKEETKSLLAVEKIVVNMETKL